MGISDETAAIVAAKLTAAHVACATANAGGAGTYETIKKNITGMFRAYFDDVRSGAIFHDPPPD